MVPLDLGICGVCNRNSKFTNLTSEMPEVCICLLKLIDECILP